VLVSEVPVRDDAGRRGSTQDSVWCLMVDRLRARSHEIEAAIFARVRDGVHDSAGSADAEYVQGLRSTVGAALDYLLAGIDWPRSGWSPHVASPPPPPVPVVALVQARRAARLGVGLDTVLRRYVAGYALLEGFIMEEVEWDELLGRGPALRGMLETSAALLDGLISPVISAYNEEAARVGPPRSALDAGAHGNRAVANVTFATGSSAVERRRARILMATVEVVSERGFAGSSVRLVVERAKVSRRTFYSLFSGLDACVSASLDDALERSSEIVASALERGDSWLEGVRLALAAMLVFFDSEPQLARVCLVHTLGSSPTVTEHRERLIEVFRGQIVTRIESEGQQIPPLGAESVLASIMGIVYARLVSEEQRPLIELLGPLIGTAMRPFVASEQMALAEKRRGDELARAIQAGEADWALPPSLRSDAEVEKEATLPSMLTTPSACRARECLCYLADHPESSNGEVAAGIGVAHRSQISRLLSELAVEKLVSRRSEGVGKRNAWQLTLRGSQVVAGLSEI
jgi:AcrR family transcriptional regulator